MVLVDPTHMLLKTSPVPDTLSDSVLSLDDEIKRVLESTSLSDHDKALNYEQVLNKYLNRVDHVNSRHIHTPRSLNQSVGLPHQDPFEKTLKLEKRIVDSLPKTLQKKGGVLLDHIKETTDMTWNERGELVVQGQTLNGTNVSDLIHEILRSRKLGIKPEGWSVFANSLKESNIPVDLIGNKARWDSTDDVDLSKSTLQSPSTPLIRKQKRGKSLKGKSKTPGWMEW